MRNLSDTLSRLAALQDMGAAAGMASAGGGRLGTLTGFGSNPGDLVARTFVPADLAPGAALVVVLHGCTQTAAGYDRGSGWSDLAERHGFALLYPEQTRANNANRCFNWFAAEDTRRDGGEVLSIRQMIAAMLAAHPIDPARVFVTGLSAGGAMTSSLLATCPDLFAGGAIVAGLPHGVARSMPEAFDRMRGHGLPDGATLARRVRDASPHGGPWPAVSVWHGSADATVAPANAEAILAQWRGVRGLAAQPDEVGEVDGHRHRQWRDPAGRVAIEAYDIAGMGHGTPLAARGANACGTAGPYMLEAGISSTRHIARSWGLLDYTAKREPAPAQPARKTPPETVADPIRKVIDDALRTAGLLR